MYNDYDDEIFLGAEAMVSLPFEPAPDEQAEGWGQGESPQETEHVGWARHAPRANAFAGGKAAVDEEEEPTLRDAIRHMLEVCYA